MERFVWLFPVLLMFHDMEEIIGLGTWLKKNRKLLDEKYPKLSERYRLYSTEGMAFAVYEEFLVSLVICMVALATDNRFIRLFWLGAFVAYTLHLVIHMGQAIVAKGYIPALITGIFSFPICVWLIWQCILELGCTVGELTGFSILGMIFMGANLLLAQSLIGKFTSWIQKL